MRREVHLDAFGFEPRTEQIRVVGSLPGGSLGLLLYEAGLKGLSDEGDLVW